MIEIIVECADCGEMMLIKIKSNSNYEEIENVKCTLCKFLPGIVQTLK